MRSPQIAVGFLESWAIPSLVSRMDASRLSGGICGDRREPRNGESTTRLVAKEVGYLPDKRLSGLPAVRLACITRSPRASVKWDCPRFG